MCELMKEINGGIISVFIVLLLACYSNIQKRHMEFIALLLLFIIYCIVYILFSNGIYEGIIGLFAEPLMTFL